MPLPQVLPELSSDISLISGPDDAVDGVISWLNEYRQSPKTFRAYRKEAERLLLWLADQGRDVRSLDRQDIDAYEAFLADPQPVARWVGGVHPRQSADWRPFRGPLSHSSRRYALGVLQNMLSWMREAGYVDHNPFLLMRNKGKRLGSQRVTHVEHYLERRDWTLLWRWLSREPADESHSQRLRRLRAKVIFGFGYLLAPRLGDLAAARMGDLRNRNGQVWWSVKGKGGKAALLPAPAAMAPLLTEWRLALNLSPEPSRSEAFPLIPNLQNGAPLSESRIYKIIKAQLAAAAAAIDAQSPATAEILRQATPHWLRHTALTHRAQSGESIRVLMKTGRHARMDTTAIYMHTEDQEWVEAANRHTL